MTLDEILLLPLVETYELEDEPADFDDLCELCDEFIEVQQFNGLTLGFVDTVFMFPVGEGVADLEDTVEGEPVYHFNCNAPTVLQETPLVFSVQGDEVVDYGVVQGTTLSVYRHKESV
jgi:hypothetical protein